MSIIALYHIKGGVGKTAAAVNLSYLAAQDGAKTLLIDLDPQGSASYYFRVRPSRNFKTRLLLKGGKKVDKNIKGTDYKNLDILPATLSYRKLDLRLNGLKKSRLILKEVLQPLEQEYKFIFIDSPPSITLVSENIFHAATILLVPVIPTTLSILTYEKLVQFFKDQKLEKSKIIAFFSMVEKRKKMHRDIMSAIFEQEKGGFLNSFIPYSADVENMGIHREPVLCFKPNSIGSESYRAIWSELKQFFTPGDLYAKAE
ncbi:MAG TPA: ParA family protein [bacterium]